MVNANANGRTLSLPFLEKTFGASPSSAIVTNMLVTAKRDAAIVEKPAIMTPALNT